MVLGRVWKRTNAGDWSARVAFLPNARDSKSVEAWLAAHLLAADRRTTRLRWASADRSGARAWRMRRGAGHSSTGQLLETLISPLATPRPDEDGQRDTRTLAQRQGTGSPNCWTTPSAPTTCPSKRVSVPP
ncbi:MAG: hypothetical protein ACRDSE_14595 [Pseudonocardiaceae bacterium]